MFGFITKLPCLESLTIPHATVPRVLIFTAIKHAVKFLFHVSTSTRMYKLQ